MKPLIVLLAVFLLGLFTNRYLLNKKLKIQTIGKWAMCSMLIFTGIAHFAFSNGMFKMLPEFVPNRILLVSNASKNYAL